jgi:antitoxin (DNA-binding transcriptional repressor) of toxin-antitoxin stability system
MHERQGTAMSTIGIKELRDEIDSVLHRVKDKGEVIEVTDEGEVVALIVPAPGESVELSNEERDARDLEALARLKRLGEEISKHWPKDVSAVDAIRDVRREL